MWTEASLVPTLVKIILPRIIFGTSKSIAFFARNHTTIAELRKGLLVIRNCRASRAIKWSQRLFKNILIA
jgi:hypothetical protein